MNPRLRGALVGAAIGAGIGALYGFAFVAYRERMREAGGQLERRVEAAAPNGQLLSPEISDPERQLSPAMTAARARLRALNERAREIAQAEGIEYRQAQRRAAEEQRQRQEEA